MEMGFSTLLDNRVEYGTVLYRLSMVVANGVESGAGRGGDREPATTGLLATPNSRGSSPGVVWFPDCGLLVSHFHKHVVRAVWLTQCS